MPLKISLDTKNKLPSFLVNYDGIALMEILLSMAVFSVTVLIFTQWASSLQSTVGLINKDVSIDNTMVKVVDAFGSNETYCNYILSNIAGNPNPNPNLKLTMTEPNGPQIKTVDLHDLNGRVLTNIVTLAAPVDGRNDLLMSDIRLKPVAMIAPYEIIANLEFKFTRQGSIGSAEATRRIPIHTKVDPVTSYVNSCTASVGNLTHIQNTICNIIFDGYAHFDETENDCIDNDGVLWVSSTDPYQAICPAGYHMAASRLEPYPQDLVCRTEGPGINLSARTYQSGATNNGANVDAWKATVDSNYTKCIFAYADVVDAHSYKPSIKCAPGASP